MASKRKCAACGSLLPANGECLNCLLMLAFEEPAPSEEPRDNARPESLPHFPGYEIIDEIARGAMGVVYRARQLTPDRIVGLKVVIGGQFAGPAEVARFKQEAEAAGRLDHPNIVPIYHVGGHEGRPFFTMPLIEGGNLSTHISQFVGDIKSAARLMAQVARAVHHAHQRGILHRDLKPSNILLDDQGEPHVTDFGLAKRLGSSVELTVMGAALGTPGYMAPEQASGESKQATTAADIFSLGAILYELVTGRPPFQSDTALAVVRKTIDEEPMPPSAIRSTVDHDLETICLKCLAKDPARRYPSAEALAEDLESWTLGAPISARPPTPWERLIHRIRLHPVRASLVGIALLAVLLTGTFFYASARTYYWLMGKISDEHLTIAPDDDGVYRLAIHDFNEARCTFNFWKDPFWLRRSPLTNRYARLLLTNMPLDLAAGLSLRVDADVPALPDVPKTPPLTNNQIFLIQGSEAKERAFYFAALNFHASNVLRQASNAAIHVILLGRPGDQNPYAPVGVLREVERH